MKLFLKSYCKCENTVEEQKQYRREFQTDAPTRLDITHIRDNLEADGSVQNIQEKRSKSPRTSAHLTKQERLLEIYHKNPRKSVRQVCCEVDISKLFVQCILKHRQWKSYIQKLSLGNNDDDTERKVKNCKWRQSRCVEDANIV